MATKRKSRSGQENAVDLNNGIDLLGKNSGSEEEDDDDTTDSEESVYSGLEDEPESSEDEELEFESDLEINQDSDASDEDDDNNKDAGENGKDESDSIGDNKFDLVNKTDKYNNNEKKKKKSTKVTPQKDNEEKDDGTVSVKKQEPDEYEDDSSDEEDVRNTVGNIPMEWYRNMSHIGYDVEGNKLMKPAQGDQLDDFLDKVDDPNYWRTVTNKLTGQNIVLSRGDVNLIKNIQGKHHPTMSNEEQHQPWIDFFTFEKMLHPLSNRPEHKRSFVPSKWEKLTVGQMLHALKMGWMKPTKKENEDEEEENKYYNLWKDDDEPEITKRYHQHIPAPKITLPGHGESYNPPPEYLFTKEEKDKWLQQEPDERRINFIPQKFSSLRHVPGFSRFVNERFERCLDLYLCPRQRKERANVDPEELLPKLPKPKDLQPFPTTQSLLYRGHTDMVRCISVDPSGQWLVSGSDDHSVRVWEVSSGRCTKTVNVGGIIKSMCWNPNASVCLVAFVVEKAVILMNPGVGDKLQVSNTDTMLSSYEKPETASASDKLSITWEVCEGQEHEQGFRLKVQHPEVVSQVTWHIKGDYFATVMPKGNTKSVIIHQLSNRRSQNPFSKSKGYVQCVMFHPVRPFLFVATQRYVRVYNLLKQELTKKLTANCKWISSMAVHPEGSNIIIGSYDSRLSWFDLDLSTKPYQTLKHHKQAIRQVCYHKRYPLFASASDDCSAIVCHGMVYNDLLQNPLIVPVKVLRGHSTQKNVGVMDCIFHPTQPWLFSAGADGTIRLYT